MAEIDFDEIRRQVAIRHSVLLDDDDPVLVTITLGEVVLSRYLDLISEQHERANQALAEVLQEQLDQQVSAAKETAGRVITEAGKYVNDQVRQAVTAGLTEANTQLQKQLAEATANSRSAQAAKGSAYVAAILAGFAALVSVAALVVVLVK